MLIKESMTFLRNPLPLKDISPKRPHPQLQQQVFINSTPPTPTPNADDSVTLGPKEVPPLLALTLTLQPKCLTSNEMCNSTDTTFNPTFPYTTLRNKSFIQLRGIHFYESLFLNASEAASQHHHRRLPKSKFSRPSRQHSTLITSEREASKLPLAGPHILANLHRFAAGR